MKNNNQQNQEKEAVSTKKVPESRSALRWYLFGFSLLGVAVGYFAGSSQSPVIGTLLPLLFGLVGGAGGLYLTRVDLERPEIIARLRIIGKALTLFIIFALMGSIYGISLRTERSILSFFSPRIFQTETRYEIPVSTQGDPKKAIEIVMLRARIRSLGVSLDEERYILQRANKLMEETDYVPTDAASSLRRLETLANRAMEDLTNTLRAHPRETGKDLIVRSCRNAEVINGYLGAYAKDYQEWAEKIEDGEKIPLAFVKYRIEGLQATIEKLLHGYEGAALWLSQHDSSRQRIWELQWALIDERSKLGSAEWLEDGSIIEELDRFLAIFYSRGAAKTEASLPWKLPELGHLR